MTESGVQVVEGGDPQDSPGRFFGRRIILTVTGGIAAYKSCYLARRIISENGSVQVVMSDSAKQFVAPLTFSTISGKPVLNSFFPDPPPSEPIHLKTASWGEIIVIAPASANIIGQIAHGLAGNLPSAIALAFSGPILLAPAMNPRMWNSRAVQDNCKILQERDFHFIGPAWGEMAGLNEEAGFGRMSEPEDILDQTEELLSDRTVWKGKTVVVTTGPTREPFDPVRFISNRSSGKMGNAVARSAILKGADVTLVRGKGSSNPAPGGVELIEVETAAEMAEVVKATFPSCDLLVMAAAVSDWTPCEVSSDKMKKREGASSTTWQQTEDILAWAGKHKKGQVVIGFAVETKDHLQEAQTKLTSKGADIIALNNPTTRESAFGGDSTRLTIISRNADPVELPVMSKRKAAEKLLEAAERFIPTS